MRCLIETPNVESIVSSASRNPIESFKGFCHKSSIKGPARVARCILNGSTDTPKQTSIEKVVAERELLKSFLALKVPGPTRGRSLARVGEAPPDGSDQWGCALAGRRRPRTDSTPTAADAAPGMLRTSVGDPDAARSGECSTPQPKQQPAEYRAEMELEGMYATLREYLQLEAKFQPKLCLPAHPEHGEVSSGARDGAAHVMRCLKMWYDLPPDVLLHAINLLDRFLTKMKVRPCHVPCISVSCMNIGIEAHARAVPVDELVSISQSGCTVGDVARMCAVVREKLSPAAPHAPVTALHWLRLLASLTAWAASELGLRDAFHSLFKERELVNQLEMVVCDAACVNIRAPELALVLLFNQLESEVGARQRRQEELPGDMQRLFDCAGELQRICQIADSSLPQTLGLVRAALARYEGRGRSEHRQRLVWRLSSRTLKVLRPTDRFLSRLPTIEEQNLTGEPAAPRPRTGSESSDDLSEESKDWPRSPVLPVYCD